MNRLLFVDDDTELLKVNKNHFQAHGYLADTAVSAEEGLLLLSRHTYDCIILDIHMKDTDGLMFCRTLRQTFLTPIIFLTNLTEEEFLIEGFHSGADDYVTKPYSLNVLELRIRARIRSISSEASDSTSEGLYIASDEKQAYINGCSLQLTANEYEILEFLKNHAGTPYRQEDIYHALWGETFYNTHSIQVMIMRIRKKIQVLSPDKDYIRTQWGKGYVYME